MFNFGLWNFSQKLSDDDVKIWLVKENDETCLWLIPLICYIKISELKEVVSIYQLLSILPDLQN